MSSKPKPQIAIPQVDEDKIPDLLKQLNAWVIWKATTVKPNGKFGKVPVDPKSGRPMNWKDPAQHLTFSDAMSAHLGGKGDGIGLVLTGEPVSHSKNGEELFLVGIDLDAACIESKNGQAEVEFTQKNIDGYAEVSPSGKGLRVFALTRKKPKSGNAGDGREMYCGKRFLTVTGRDGRGKPKDATAGILALEKRWWPDRQRNPSRDDNLVTFPGLDFNLNFKLMGLNAWLETDENIGKVKQALGYIPPDCDYETWRSVVWAVASLGWSCGRELIENWSRNSPKHWEDGGAVAQAAIDRLLDDYQPEKGITIGTMLHFAHENGMPGEGALEEGSDCTLPEFVLEMNKQYAWVEAQKTFYRFEFGDFIKQAELVTQHKNRPLIVKVEDGKDQRQCRIAAWIAHPDRAQYRDLVFAPGEPAITGKNEINTWTGFAVDPVEGDIQPYEQLRDHLFPDPQERRYVEQWLAHKLKFPGIKMNTALVVWSEAEGVGKNLLFETVSTIIGAKHACVIGQRDLTGNFNPWAKNRVFVIGDEVLSGSKRQEADQLKGLITGTTLRINEKNQPEYDISNFTNFVFLSNHCDAVHITEGSRRYFVSEIKAQPLCEKFYAKYAEWRDNGGCAALHYHLVNDVDLAGFDPKAPAPNTAAKDAMISAGRSGLEQWMVDALDDPVGNFGGFVITTAMLKAEYELATNDTRSTAKAVSSAAQKAGAVPRASQIRFDDGTGEKKVRVMSLANHKDWGERSETDWAAELRRVRDHLLFR